MSARSFAVASMLAVGLAGCGSGPRARAAAVTPPHTPVDPILTTSAMTGTVRIAYLHHSTGGVVWAGGAGVAAVIADWNTAHGTDYRIDQLWYPSPDNNMPYDWWNLWVNGGGAALDTVAATYDVVVLKHCYPASYVDADDGNPLVSSSTQTRANYELQYAALKARLREYGDRRFVVWTAPALLASHTNAAEAGRALAFSTWVRDVWDTHDDNVYVWDFRALEAEPTGGLYLPTRFSDGSDHPNAEFATSVAPLVARRIIDVIEGRGDVGSVTGQ
jgi:hypothetical protein